jgi:transcriptional regulator
VSIYLPPAFASSDIDAVAQLIVRHSFATLVTPTANAPQISHLPLLLHRHEGAHGVLIGHVARANPHWRALPECESIAIFHGPHAYVSPSWYSDPAAMVPTWNYAVVHVHGIGELIDDPEGKRATVEELTAHFEASRPAPWHLQLTGARLAAMLDAIVAFRIPVSRVEAKFKMSQNRSGVDRARVAAALHGESDADAVATGDWMMRDGGEG